MEKTTQVQSRTPRIISQLYSGTNQHLLPLRLRVSRQQRQTSSHLTYRSMLHDPHHCHAPQKRRSPSRTCRYRKNLNRQRFRQRSSQIRCSLQLFRRSWLQKSWPHVFRIDADWWMGLLWLVQQNLTRSAQCGGPANAIYPQRPQRIKKRRIQQLKSFHFQLRWLHNSSQRPMRYFHHNEPRICW